MAVRWVDDLAVLRAALKVARMAVWTACQMVASWGAGLAVYWVDA